MITHFESAFTRRAFLRLCGLVWLGGRAANLRQPIFSEPPGINGDVQPRLTPLYTFDSFVVRPHNKAAFTAAWAVAQKPFFTYNPLFIHGPAGFGKTHLLLALGQHLATSDPNRQILYLPAPRFAYLVDKTAVGASAARRFCERFRRADVILIDNLHRLTDETACDFVPPDGPHHITGAVAQNVLQALFDEMYGTLSNLFVFSSVCAPDLIPGLSRHLVQRCSWGMVEEIQRPATGRPS